MTIVFECGQTYRYSWNTLKRHPTFWVTKHLLSGSRLCVSRDCCPEIYVYLNRYIVYGVKLNLKFITKRTGCPPEIVLHYIKKQGFGPEICEEESTLPQKQEEEDEEDPFFTPFSN